MTESWVKFKYINLSLIIYATLNSSSRKVRKRSLASRTKIQRASKIAAPQYAVQLYEGKRPSEWKGVIMSRRWDGVKYLDLCICLAM